MTRALIVVDVQNDFCEGGALGVEGGAEVARRISEELLMNTPYDVVAFTKDWHIEPGDHWSDEPDFVDSWPKHCQAQTSGADFHDNLIEGFGYVSHPGTNIPVGVVYKGQWEAAYSGFEGETSGGGASLDNFLAKHGVSEVDIVGIAYDHCVRATALDAVSLGYKTNVILPLTAPVSKERAWDVTQELLAAGVTISG